MALNGSEVNSSAVDEDAAVFFSGSGQIVAIEQSVVSVISGSGQIVAIEQTIESTGSELIVTINQMVW